MYANDQLTAAEYKSMLDYIDTAVKTKTSVKQGGYKDPLTTKELSMK